MKKVAVVYWSGTGNTKQMAEYIAEGVRKAGEQAYIFTPDRFEPGMIDAYDAIAFGCPAMGIESLEEGEFAPMFGECQSRLKSKKIALFGSYGWGSGEWMRKWEKECNDAGAVLMGEGVKCCGSPDEIAYAECLAQGEFLVR
ncbi:MAG: flavodoxin [Clostridia bacterium]|nr:flavodoxin [Clostridia bacterium]MBR4954686.1 flavodoxin [Clostridia bacterium]